MSPEEREKILADIQLALKNFPKVIQQKKRAHRHKERIMKPFMKLARQLEKRIAEQLSSSKDGESIDGLDKLLAPAQFANVRLYKVRPHWTNAPRMNFSTTNGVKMLVKAVNGLAIFR